MGNETDRIKFSVYKKLLPYLVPYQWHLALGILLAAVLSITNGATALVVRPLLDEVFVKKDPYMLRLMPYVIVSIFLVKGLARFSQAYLVRGLGQKIVTRIRKELYDHLLKMPLGFYQRTHPAVLMSRMTNDINLLSDISSQVISKFFQHFFTLVALLLVIFYQEWRLATLYCLILPILVIPLYIVGKKLRKISYENQTCLARLNTLLQETFYGLKIIKSFVAEPFVGKYFDTENRKLLKINQRGIAMEELFTPIMEITGALGGALVVFFGGMMVIEGISTPGQFFSFMTAVGMLYNPLRKLSKMHGVLQKSLAAADRVWEILEQRTEISGQEGLITFKGLKSAIVFKNVSLSIEGGKPVLENINLSIKAGESVALLGFSGSGRTALVDLIPRFYDLDGGEILLDGINLRDYTMKSLRERIGIVSQETIIFADTIKNNIALEQEEIDNSRVVEASKKAFLHDFIISLPAGYETVLDVNNDGFSKKQRRLLTFARTFYKNPDILIIDETDTTLDAGSDGLIAQILTELMKNKTSLIITPSLGVARLCSQIIVMDKGKIVEQGTHEELSSKSGLYQKLSGLPLFDRRSSSR
jgi:subfamily B ATP-binding cassette protein MsbA